MGIPWEENKECKVHEYEVGEGNWGKMGKKGGGELGARKDSEWKNRLRRDT